MESSDLEREMREAVDLMEGIVSEHGYRVDCPNHAAKKLTYDGFAKAADDIKELFLAAAGSAQ
jgi:hypothetical protein